MPRRMLAGAVLALLVLLGAGAEAAPAEADFAQWFAYRARFVVEGRVVDSGNGGISHSEGQGWGMLLAESFGDRQTFDALWQWTRTVLARPVDSLFVWRWPPQAGQTTPDLNDAGDGDIFIAWALVRASERWGDQAHAAAARAILADVKRFLVRSVDGRLVLLPGAAGFEDEDGVTLNPSYYVFPAFAAFARFDADGDWIRLAEDGRALLRDGRFGRWQLPPDWLRLGRGGAMQIADGWPPRFGYDAVRIPLYLMWGRGATADQVAPFAGVWSAYPGAKPPAWFDLVTGETAPYAAPTGFRAIRDALAAAARRERPDLPRITPSDDYFSASLILLAKLASAECLGTR